MPEKALDEAVAKAIYRLPRAALQSGTWTLESHEVVCLIEKMKRVGTPLCDYMGLEPLYGIKTGMNNAFLITKEERDDLVGTDPALDTHIRPYLRGQDLRRWSSTEPQLYMILMKSSSDHAWPWAGASDEVEAERQFRASHAGLYAHFKRFEEFKDPKSGKLRGLRHREDQGRWWWELRPCAYYDAFTKPKVNIQRIAFHSRFSVDQNGAFLNDSAVILPAQPLLACAVLNQPIAWYFQFKKFPHKKDEAVAMDIAALNQFPMPNLGARAGNVEAQVELLISRTETVTSSTESILTWLRHEFQLEKLGRALLTPSAVDADSFVALVRDALPKKQKLTAAEVAELKREHAATIEPARQARAEIFALEGKLSDLVNEAYGLTPDDVDLMWRTAPPRMPFTPAGLSSDIADREENGSEEDADA